jgi:hypothetical protein
VASRGIEKLFFAVDLVGSFFVFDGSKHEQISPCIKNLSKGITCNYMDIKLSADFNGAGLNK